jgi:GT2 family glycosyltransferase
MLPERLKLQVHAMSDDSVGLCHTQFQFIDGNGNVTGAGLARKAQYRDFLKGNGMVFLSSVVARRALIQEVGGFNSTLAIGEDLDLIFRIAREGTVGFLPQVLSEYRRHGNNTWLNATSGGREIKQILTQHLWAAELQNRAEDAKAARTGLATSLTGRAAAAMFRASEARARRDRKTQMLALGESFVFSPIISARVILRAIRREGFKGVGRRP